MKNIFQKERYQTQIALKEIGEYGQEKLAAAKVLVIGAGGLGCPALLYLAGAGVGTIGIVDDDVVCLSNLHRQIIFNTDTIGSSKVIAAKNALQKLNPDICIQVYNQRIDNRNAIDIFKQYDLIIDGTDNLSSKYLINDACVLLKKPFVYAGISGYEGQVAFLNTNENAANYRDLFPVLASDGPLNCRLNGVIGVLPGIIGTMQAAEAIKWICGIGELAENAILTYHLLEQKIYKWGLMRRPENQYLMPKNVRAFEGFDYPTQCVADYKERPFLIEVQAFEILRLIKGSIVVDIRQEGELPIITEFEHLCIDLQDLPTQVGALPYDVVLLLCNSGHRSSQVMREIQAICNGSKVIYSLMGGIIEWKNYHKLKKHAKI